MAARCAQNEQVRIAAWLSFSLYRGDACALSAEVNNAASRVHAPDGQSIGNVLAEGDEGLVLADLDLGMIWLAKAAAEAAPAWSCARGAGRVRDPAPSARTTARTAR